MRYRSICYWNGRRCSSTNCGTRKYKLAYYWVISDNADDSAADNFIEFLDKYKKDLVNL